MLESFSLLALQRWLAVTLPLMAITFSLAFWWYQSARNTIRDKSRQLEIEFPDVMRQSNANDCAFKVS